MPRALLVKVIVMVVVAMVASAGAPVAAAAEGNDPRVGQARTACLAGDRATGMRLLAELYTETRDPVWIFNQGRCLQQNRALDEALARFREYLRTNDAARPELNRQARTLAAEIEAELAARSPRAPRAPDTAATARESSVALTPAISALTAPAPEAAGGISGRTLRFTGIAMAGAGAVAAVAGVVFSVKVNQLSTEVRTAPPGTPTFELQDKIDRGERLEAWQWVSYATGAIMIAGGAVFYVIGNRAGDGVSGMARHERQRSMSLAVVSPVPGGIVAAWRGRY